MLALLALLACGSVDPELASQRAALERWEEGKAHLEEGRSAEAVEAFEEAISIRPKDPVLRAWLAQAHARQGDLDRAIAELDTLLVEYPTFAEARYNRAAYLARQGDLQAAAADLQKALEGGAARARDVLDDPDFAPHLDDPAFAFLPRTALEVAVEVPDGPAFLGNQVDVRLRVLGTDEEAVQVRVEEASGPVELLKVVENRVQTPEGRVRELTYTFEVVGPGDVEIGPVEVQSAGHTAQVAPITFEAVAPEGREGRSPRQPIALTTASEVGALHGLPSATWLEGTHLLVKALPGDRIEVEPDPGTPARIWEMRDEGQPQWILYRYDLESPPTGVRVRRNGATVLEGAPASG